MCRLIGRDAVMAGERDFEAAAERGAVDGAGDRLAAGLKPAQHSASELETAFKASAGGAARGQER